MIISGHKWYATHIVLKSHRSKMGVIYMQSWKQCALLIINTMALWQLMHLGIWCTSCTQVHELPQSHCSDNREGILFSGLHTYYIYMKQNNCNIWRMNQQKWFKVQVKTASRCDTTGFMSFSSVLCFSSFSFKNRNTWNRLCHT